MDKQVLLINDLAGYGKVALSAMIPVLSHMGFHLYTLPTALVSNTLDYGKFDILETTEYVKNSIRIWGELGFSFDAVSTGFIISERQAELIASFCAEQSKRGVQIFTDPIMGDEGKLYNGLGSETVIQMRKLIAVADYAVPNYTEAAYLAGTRYSPESLSRQAAEGLVDALREMGAKSVVITSARVEGQDAVVGYDHVRHERFLIAFQMIPARFPGTGDIFSSILMGNVLRGRSLEDSTRRAMDAVREMIRVNQDNVNKFKGIPVEGCLNLID